MLQKTYITRFYILNIQFNIFYSTLNLEIVDELSHKVSNYIIY